MKLLLVAIVGSGEGFDQFWVMSLLFLMKKRTEITTEYIQGSTYIHAYITKSLRGPPIKLYM